MKKKVLSLFSSRVLLLVMAFVGAVSSAWAADETVTFSNLYSTNTVLDGEAINGTNFSLTFQKRNSGTATQYYTNGTSVRWYGGGTLTITSTKTIEMIEITFTQTANTITTDVGDYSNGTWEGSAKSVVFSQSGTSGHCRISAIAVTYASTGGDTPTLTESDFALTGDTDLSFDLYDNDDAQVINFTTSSTGAVTVAGNAYVSAVVDNGTITVTPLKKTNGKVEITVNQAKDDNYKAGSATFTVTITDSTPVGDVNEETITFSELGYNNAEDITKVDGKATTLTFDKGGNTSNSPKYYDSGNAARMYNGNTLTIESEKTIESIVFTFDGSYTTLTLPTGQPGSHASP